MPGTLRRIGWIAAKKLRVTTPAMRVHVPDLADVGPGTRAEAEGLSVCRAAAAPIRKVGLGEVTGGGSQLNTNASEYRGQGQAERALAA